jgi:hypothetical protein
MILGRRSPALFVILLLGIAASGVPVDSGSDLSGQDTSEVRILAVVDYLAGSDIYLAAGTDHGIRASDTLRVFDGDGTEARLLGTLGIVSLTAKRSVANIVFDLFSIEKGAFLYLGIPSERLAEAEGGDPLAALPGPRTKFENTEQGQEADAPRLSVEIHGRVSLDFDALRTTTRWSDRPDAQEERSFSTPTFRLQARAQNLPGGFTLGTGVRLSHRMSSDSIVQPVTSTRLYQFDLEKRFDRVPLELHLGRFYNPFDELSGFWDGALFRIGPPAFGGGVAVGFEPQLGNEGFSSQRPKVSGFLDFDARGETLGYSGSVSFLGIRPENGLPDRNALGLSQRIRIGRAWINHRLQVDRDPVGSDWNVTRIQVDGFVSLGGGLAASAGWRRWRSVPLWEEAAILGPQEDRSHVGLSYWGSMGGGSVDMSLTNPRERENGRTLSGSFYLIQTPIPGVGLGGAVSRWSRGDHESLLVSPELRFSLGPVDIRGAHRLYRTVTTAEEVTTQFTDVGLSVPLGGGAFLRLQGSTQFGGDLSNTRFFASLWKGF